MMAAARAHMYSTTEELRGFDGARTTYVTYTITVAMDHYITLHFGEVNMQRPIVVGDNWVRMTMEQWR